MERRGHAVNGGGRIGDTEESRRANVEEDIRTGLGIEEGT